MNTHDISLVIHVGYPKTATTTFQQHVFPYHPEIEYLGKFIPSFRFTDEKLYGLIDEILHRGKISSPSTSELRSRVDDIRARSSRSCVLISSESFIHPSVVDVATVADRLHAALYPCKILITIREQLSTILSFYWMHGRYGEYLSIGAKYSEDHIHYPIPFLDWVRFQQYTIDRNVIGILHYDAVIRYYREKFGASNVCVLLYEQLRIEPDAYLRDLSAFLGVGAQPMHELMSGRHENRSEGRSSPWEGSEAGKIIAEWKQSGAAAALGRIFKRRQIAAEDVKIKQELARLRESYRAGNAQLAHELSLPLDRYGYAI